jgi:PucR-like helix-turn-helix protein/diguanylate cyclase with GGDEF domain
MPETSRTFAAIPPETADVLRPVLSGLADETIAAIAAEVPDYARAMEGDFGAAVRNGVEVAFQRFLRLVLDPEADMRSARETYVDLGRGEYHAGRSLDALLAAYRVGARMAWRRFVETGRDAGLAPEVLYDLGEAIFAYIDEISAESADGYAQEQSAAAGEAQRRRRRLVRVLAEEPPPSEEAIRTVAAAAGWRVPRRLAALVVPAPEGTPEDLLDADAAALARRIGADAVGAAVDGRLCVFVPDPRAPGRRRALEAALLGARAALGPAVPWSRPSASVRRAASALALPLDGLVIADEHLATLLLTADPALGAELAATRLAPLEGLAERQRERMEATLRAWLDRPGQVQAVAAELGVHPQTVRYRMIRLRELFGDRLEDPESRFELGLALRVTPMR